MSVVAAHLRAYVAAGVLTRVDVGVAEVVARHGRIDDPRVWLATAVAAAAPRDGHACAELHRVAERAARTASQTIGSGDQASDGPAVPEAVPELAWPSSDEWRTVLAASGIVADPDTAGDGTRPLVLDGDRLYLLRFWLHTTELAARLAARASAEVPVAPEPATAVLDRLFDGAPSTDRQRLAAGTALTARLCVVSGAPGTGKTTTATRIIAALVDTAEGPHPPRVALAAPTGKAAARLGESVAAERVRLADRLTPAADAVLAAVEPATIHRLLGSLGRSSSRFRHDQANPLQADVVVIDEASMVPLALMDRLVAAVAPQATLILLGDADQLASVEAGAVLGEICGPVGNGHAARSAPAAARVAALGCDVAVATGGVAPIADAVVRLDTFHRFGEGSDIGDLSRAVRDGDAAAARAILDDPGRGDVTLHDTPVATLPSALQAALLDGFTEVARAARSGDGEGALSAVESIRLLCALRRGPEGADAWNRLIGVLLAERLPGLDPSRTWWAGRPVLVTTNDHAVKLFNGDLGVCVTGASGTREVAFPAPSGVRRIGAGRLPAHDTAFATTIHKAQGSQVRHAVVVLGSELSPVHTRELAYTGITRASQCVDIIASARVWEGALAAHIERSGGLGVALHGSTPRP